MCIKSMFKLNMILVEVKVGFKYLMSELPQVDIYIIVVAYFVMYEVLYIYIYMYIYTYY